MWLTVDPGIVGTGLAYWDDGTMEFSSAKIIYPPRRLTDVERCRYLFNRLNEELSNNGVKNVYCEKPTYFESSKGVTSARRGDLLTLQSAACMVMGAAFAYRYCTFDWVSIAKWKGTLPKQLVYRRIEEILGKKIIRGIKSHALDAVGIGLYLRGEF